MKKFKAKKAQHKLDELKDAKKVTNTLGLEENVVTIPEKIANIAALRSGEIPLSFLTSSSPPHPSAPRTPCDPLNTTLTFPNPLRRLLYTLPQEDHDLKE